MENTSPKELRAKLKEFLDIAKKEAVRIKRRSGQCYILLSEEKYNDIKMELNTLQKRLLGKGHVDEKVKTKENDKENKEKNKDKKKNKTATKSAEKKIKAKKATKKISKAKT